MSLLTVYLIGFVITAIFVNYRSPSKIRSGTLIGMSLAWPLTWIGIIVVNVRAGMSPEYREEIHQIRKEYEEDVDGR